MSVDVVKIKVKMQEFRDQEREDIDVIVLSDSILKYCYFLPLAILLAITGAGVEEFIHKQFRGEIVQDWAHYNLCILHLGTNDVANGNARYVFPRIKRLITLIRRRNPHIKFIVCSILPRPRDHRRTRRTIRRVHEALRSWARTTSGVAFYPSHRSFTSDFKIRADQSLFCWDGLHLNHEGVGRMERLIKQLVTLFKQGRLASLQH